MLPFAGHHDQAKIPHLVAEILNGEPDTTLPSHVGTSLLEDAKGNRPEYREAMLVAKNHLRITLRQLVDQWIDSGRGFVDGAAEVPNGRSLFQRPVHSFALHNYLSGWFQRNPPTIGLLSGQPATHGGFDEQPAMFLQFSPPQLNENVPPELGGILWGQELAGYWLVRLINCPAQTRFARCTETGCGHYFVYQRSRKERFETYCPAHKGKDANRRVNRANEKKRKRRITAAAEWWDKWLPEYGDRSEWVAGQAQKDKGLRVNDAFGKRFVNSYATEIERASRGEKNAKG